jgi:hypothetical protein
VTVAHEYRVVGSRIYRGHKPGSKFIAHLGREVAQRAISRGDIEVIRQLNIQVVPGSYTFPAGWLGESAETQTPGRG